MDTAKREVETKKEDQALEARARSRTRLGREVARLARSQRESRAALLAVDRGATDVVEQMAAIQSARSSTRHRIRMLHLARAFLRGVPYRAVERTNREPMYSYWIRGEAETHEVELDLDALTEWLKR